MLVSIVMPTFRQKRNYLKQSIKALLKQTHTDLELIIVPVKLDFPTFDVLKQFRDERIVVRPSNYALITHQMNVGAYAARGKYILPGVGSDDCYYRKSVASMVKFAKAKDAVITYPDFDVGNSSLKIKRTKRCPKFNRKLLNKGCYMCDDSLVIREEFMKYMPMKNSDAKSRIWNVWKNMGDNSEYRNRIRHIRLRSHIYRDHGDAVHRHGSQREFRAVELKSPNIQPSSGLKVESIARLSRRDFCVYIKDIPLFARHLKNFKFKKVVLHWDEDNIQHLPLISDTELFYNLSSPSVYDVVKEYGMKFLAMFDEDNYIADYIVNDPHDMLVLESA